MKSNNETKSMLRLEAERILAARSADFVKKTGRKRSLTELLHDLQIYQVELEMQNDELKLSQGALEIERQRFESLFNLSPHGYFVLNEFAVTEECNDSGLLILNAQRSIVINRRFQNFIFPEDASTFYLFLKKLLISQDTVQCQLRLVCKDRGLAFVELQGKTVSLPESLQKKFYVAVIDMSEKKQAEHRQRESHERLQMALAASDAGTWQMHLKSGAISLDVAALSIFGLKPHTFDGKFTTLLKMVHPEDQSKLDSAIRAAMVKNKNLQIEYRTLDETKQMRYLEARGHIVMMEKGENYFIGLITDITKRKLLEKEAEDMKASQQKVMLKAIIDTQEHERGRISNALHDSVGQLLYGVSLKLQQTKSIGDPAFSSALQFIDLAVRETRRISFELAPSLLSDYGLVVALPEIVNRLISPQLKITHKITGCEKRLELNAEVFIFRIIQELLNNVIKHSKASEAHLELKYAKKQVSIKMKDNGVGFTTKTKELEGTGLRSIKNRIALYNGTINIVTQKKKGTTITIQLFNVV